MKWWKPREICFIATEKIDQRKYAHWLLKNQLDLGPAVNTTPEEFENRALFLRLGLPSTLIRRNCPPKTELFKNALENGGINNDVTIIRWFVCPSLPQTQIQNGGRNGDCHVDFTTWVQLKPCYAHAHGCTQAFLPRVIVGFSNFSGVVCTENIFPFSSVDEKHLMCFQSETSVFKFLRRRCGRGLTLKEIKFYYCSFLFVSACICTIFKSFMKVLDW